VSNHVQDLVRQRAPYDKSTYSVLLALADWADDEGRLFCLISTLAHNARCSKRTAQRAIRRLEADGFLEIHPRPRRCNVYTINVRRLALQSRWIVPDDAETKGDKMTPQGCHRDRGGMTQRRGGDDTGDRGGVTPCHPDPCLDPCLEPEERARTREGAEIQTPHPEWAGDGVACVLDFGGRPFDVVLELDGDGDYTFPHPTIPRVTCNASTWWDHLEPAPEPVGAGT